MPNLENCSLGELVTTAKASPVQRSYIRLMAIKALAMGLTHEQVATLFEVNEDSVSRWVKRFNERGIDGLTEGLRSGRPPKIGAERSNEYRKLVLHPELVKEARWTGRKFHGYLTQQCQFGAGYSTLMRWLHDEGFRLKFPRRRKRFAMKGDKIRQSYIGAHIRMNVTGMVLPSKDAFYALEFSHSDTAIFQIFLDHA